MIYISTPFGNHEEVSTKVVFEYALQNIKNSIISFSPITYFTTLFAGMDLADYTFWQLQCEGFMDKSDKLHCMFLYDDINKSMDAILNSRGALEEIYYFLDMRKEVSFVRKVDNKYVEVDLSTIDEFCEKIRNKYEDRK